MKGRGTSGWASSELPIPSRRPTASLLTARLGRLGHRRKSDLISLRPLKRFWRLKEQVAKHQKVRVEAVAARDLPSWASACGRHPTSTGRAGTLPRCSRRAGLLPSLERNVCGPSLSARRRSAEEKSLKAHCRWQEKGFRVESQSP